MKCEKCSRKISNFRLANCWPTKISCKLCKEQYSVKFGHLIGLLTIAAIIPFAILPFYLVSFLGVEENGLYSKGNISRFVVFLGPILVYVLFSQAYGGVLKRFCNIQRKEP